MDLVPVGLATSDLQEQWEKSLLKAGCQSSECYGGYHDLSAVLHKYIKPADTTLIIGGYRCNNGRLAEDLYDAGYHSLICTDTSEAAVKKTSDRNRKLRPEMKFVKSYFEEMAFGDASMNVVLDRGIADFLISDSNKADLAKANPFFDELQRVLKIGGRYICITFEVDCVASRVLNYFVENSWMIRLHKVTCTNKGSNNTASKYMAPVFAFICTKLKMIAGMRMPLEICMTDSMTPSRVESIDNVITAIRDCQNYAMVRLHLQSRTGVGEGIYVKLYQPSKPSHPRYTMHVVDSNGNFGISKKFAIFVTPQGRESEWMFAAHRGRVQLAESAGFQRLLVVSLHRDHSYTDMDSIKAELSCWVMELAPPGIEQGKQVPFLSIGDDIGQREVRYRGNSDLTGDFVVEDVKGDNGDIFRRLLFLNGTLIQSQARLIKDRPRKSRHKQKDKGATPNVIIDYGYLDFNFHKHMVAGLAAIPHFPQLLSSEGMRMLIVGLGAGMLPMFLYHHFPKLQIDVVELDGAVAEMAKTCFGFVENHRMQLFVMDGLQYIRNLKKETTHPIYQAIVFDVDAKDLSTGLNSPPKLFIEKEFLQKVDSILHPQGVFMLNLISRDSDIKQCVINDIKTIFPLVFTRGGEDEVNETLYAVSRPRDDVMTSSTCGIIDATSLEEDIKGTPSSPQDIEGAPSSPQDIKGATSSESISRPRDDATTESGYGIKGALSLKKDFKEGPSSHGIKRAPSTEQDIKSASSSKKDIKSAPLSKQDVKEALSSQQDVKGAPSSPCDIKGTPSSPCDIKGTPSSPCKIKEQPSSKLSQNLASTSSEIKLFVSNPNVISNSATELLGSLPDRGKQLQRLAQSSGKDWDTVIDLCEILRQLEMR